MGRGLYPDHRAASAYVIDYEELYRQGYRGIIYDIDNTLVLPDAPADRGAIALFQQLRSIGFSTVILSNNTGERARTFAQQVGSACVEKARKPLPGKYLEAMRVMGTDRGNTLFVGDQIFTDIWGANNAGITSFLTNPFTSREEIQIVLKRVLEKPVLWLYEHRNR